MGSESHSLRATVMVLAIGLVYGESGKHCLDLISQERVLEKLMAVETKMNLVLDSLEDVKQMESGVASSGQVLVIQNLEVDGWRMIFRATSGNGYNVYDAWTTGVNIHSVKPQTMARSLGQHYMDPIVSKWGSLGIEYIKVALFNEDKEVAHVIFNGKGSDKINWFAKENVISSSYSDLTSNSEFNKFSIAGDFRSGDIERRFLINRHYGGCPQDRGHLAVIDTRSPKGCAWDSHVVYPQFLYSLINSVDYWDRRMFGRADYMAIFVKTIL